MEVRTLLTRLGLNDKEVGVFMALAKLGPSPVRTVAQHAGVNRGTTYDTLKHLLEQGLVSYYHQEKHQYFMAESPERLLERIDDRVHQEQETRRELEAALPELRTMYATPRDKATVKYYEGFRGARAILRDVLITMSRAEKKEYYVYSALDLRQYLYKEFPNFTDERVKRGINVKTIAIGGGGSLHGLDERRWLSRKESAPTFVIIYDGKVARLALDHNQQLMGILIESQPIAETEMLIFRHLWERLGAE